MFTGLIREIATIENIQNQTITIKSKYSPKNGDSIAINGICLTATDIFDNSFNLDISDETIKSSNIGNYQISQKVHLEPAMKLSDRLEGHILQGHIDCIGEVVKIEEKNSSVDMFISYEKEQSVFMSKKGSVAIDGVSLTINDVFDNIIRLTIIPHTFKNTIFNDYKISQKVNIESDFFAKYIFNIMQNKKKMSWEDIDFIQGSY